jgi:F-type H+-transporting ATPase subunit alpha
MSSWTIESPSPSVVSRVSVSTPYITGLISVDSLIPVGRGQRELILGDRISGKTSLYIDSLLSSKYYNVVCVVASVGSRATAVIDIFTTIATLDAIYYVSIIKSSPCDSTMLLFLAPYASMSVAEF